MSNGAFQCPKCGEYTNSVVFIEKSKVECEHTFVCKRCLNSLTHKNTTAPAVHGCDSFNSYYDSQLGEYVESKEHKAHLLKQYGLTQVAGHESPRQSSKWDKLLTKDQARAYKAHIDKIRSK